MRAGYWTTLSAVILLAISIQSIKLPTVPKSKALARLNVRQTSRLPDNIPLNGPLPLSVLAVEDLRHAESPPPADARTAPKPAEEPCPRGLQKTGEARFRNYVVRTYRWPDPDGCFEILRGGKQVYTEPGAEFKIGGSPALPLANKEKLLVPIGTDVTGLGVPNLVVGEWGGGAHCCFDFWVFELGEKFRLVAKIEADDSELAYFSDVDHDGRYEFVAYDWTFDYWHASFLQSPAPAIVLRFRDGAFHLAPDIMRKPPPSTKQTTAWARQIKSDPRWENPEDPPSNLWGFMLEFIYTGHAQMAWSFFETNWRPERKGKNEFLKEFRARLKESPYYKDLEELNSGKLW